MSFRDNLQYLRATRNMTQEQLAMLLGVSRQSVSKWEAERAYPEMDKLLRICALFECTLDELVTGDLTERPANEAARMPTGKTLQDVTGYEQAMESFALKLPLGIACIIAGCALAILFSDPSLVPGAAQNYAYLWVFVGIAVGIALILPAAFQRSSFHKAHPFVDDFYTVEQKDQARSRMVAMLVGGIGLLMAGSIAAVLLQTDVWLAAGAFFMLAAVGVFVIVRGSLIGSRCNLAHYNKKSLSLMGEEEIALLGDEELQSRARRAKHERSIYGIVMSVATAVGLLLLFIPALNAQRWFWLAWPVGGILCGTIKAIRSLRSGA